MTVASSSQNLSQIDILSTNDGLSFRDVRSVVQDSLGLMWFGTNQGIDRYDGYQFKLYNSNQSNPYYIEKETVMGDLVIDSDGYLWYIANNDLYKLNTRTDRYYAYGKKQGVCGEVKYLYQDIFDNIYIVSDDQWMVPDDESKQYLQKLNDGKFETVAESPRGNEEFTSISSNSLGELVWSTCSEGTMFFDREGVWKETTKLDSFNWYGEEIYFVHSFHDLNNTHYIFPESKGGVEIYNRETGRFDRILDVSQVVFHAVEDAEANLWFATLNRIYRYSSDGVVYDFTDLAKSQHDFFKINDLYIDKNQLLWVATDNGLIKITVGEAKFKQIFNSKTEGWGNTMRSIFETPKNGMLAFCEVKRKLIQIDSNQNTSIFNLKGDNIQGNSLLQSARFFKVDERDNSVYTVNDRLIKINLDDRSSKSYNQFKSRLKSSSANPLERLPNGNLIFGYSLSELTIFNPVTEESRLVFPTIKVEDDLQAIRFILAGKEEGVIWIGTQNDGVAKIHEDGKILGHYHSQSNLKLSKNWVLVLYEELPDRLWIGLYGGGLNLLDLNKQAVTEYSLNEGLPDNNVVGIIPVNKDQLWISTYNGISCFDKNSSTFRNFYEEDGLTHNEFNYSSYYKTKDGYLYFGGMNGINRFRPDDLLKGRDSSKILLTGASIYNSRKNTTINKDFLNYPVSELEVSPYDHSFQLEWTIPDYFKSDMYQYYTKMEGLEDSWFYLGNSNSIRYNKLPANDYVLRIKGADANGILFTDELRIPIKVKQIFYKKWWFIALVIAVVGFVIYLIFNYRLQQLLAMERLRTRISSDLHDDVGSMLSGLAMQSELLQMNAAPEDRSKLKKIADISRSAVSQMRDLVWSIDSRRERVADLIDRMHELAEELLLPKGISFNIDSEFIDSNKKLKADVKQNLFLIFKEAMSNILRHSNATHVDVRLHNTSKGCELKIKDNGEALAQQKSTGLGLSNMRMRAERMNGQINFEQEKGFEISLALPFLI